MIVAYGSLLNRGGGIPIITDIAMFLAKRQQFKCLFLFQAEELFKETLQRMFDIGFEKVCFVPSLLLENFVVLFPRAFEHQFTGGAMIGVVVSATGSRRQGLGHKETFSI